MIAEYLKALGERDVHNLRMLLNEVLSGRCIPNEWKESIVVVLVHKGGSKKELKELYTSDNHKCNLPGVYEGGKRENK